LQRGRGGEAALALAGHQQMAQNAFEAAESGIVAALLRLQRCVRGARCRNHPPLTKPRREPLIARRRAGFGRCPAVGFSVGENAGTFAARHYFITADSESGRSTRARLEQGFYLVVPAS
jgi:hypothetical protein